MTYEEWWGRTRCDICAKDGKPVGTFMIEKYGNPVSKAAWDACSAEMNESLQVERTHVKRLVAENARLERELAEARGNEECWPPTFDGLLGPWKFPAIPQDGLHLYPGATRYEGYAALFHSADGSEFVVLAPTLDALDAAVVANRIRNDGEPVDRARCAHVEIKPGRMS